MTISSTADKARVDSLRASMDALLVGGRTLLDEDPKLTVKSLALRSERKAAGLEENPIKIGVVGVANLQPDGNFMTAGPSRRLIYTTRRTPLGQIIRLEKAGVKVFVMGDQRVDCNAMLESLYDLGIRKLMVEGGGTMIAEFFRLDLVDELMLVPDSRQSRCLFCGWKRPKNLMMMAAYLFITWLNVRRIHKAALLTSDFPALPNSVLIRH